MVESNCTVLNYNFEVLVIQFCVTFELFASVTW